MAAKGPDWRQGNKRTTGASPAAGAGKRDWQRQSTPQSGPRKPWSRGSKLTLAVVLLSFFIGGVYVVIQWFRPVSPAGLVLMGASYDDNLAVPHNAFGWKNLDDLNKLKDEPGLFSDAGKLDLLYRSGELNGADAWKKEWDVFHGKIREKTVVLFLALHGAADSGGPFFFVGDDQGTARLPFADVLASLDGSKLANKNILLIIEPALVRANWSSGVLENTFVEKLLELKSKFKPNLFILCASDAHQTSWSSEEWQQTVFGHYVIEGLRGGAANANLRVTVGDLAKYVTEKVSTWSQRNRGVEQTPILIGDKHAAAEIELEQLATRKESGTEAPGLAASMPGNLRGAWDEWQKLRDRTPHPSVYSPSLWRRYQEMLVRYEQLLRAGDPTKKAGDIAGRLVAMQKKLEAEARFEPADATMSLTLPMADALGIPLPVPDAELRQKIQRIWDEPKREKRDELLKELVEWAKKDDVKLTQLRVQTYRILLDDILKRPAVNAGDLLGDQGDKDDPRPKAVAILDLLEGKLGSPRPAEVHYLSMLLKDISKATPPDFNQLRDSLKIRILAEQATLAVAESGKSHPYSEILYPWNHKRLAAADAARRPGEDLLFASTKSDWDESLRLLEQAKKDYQAIQKDSAVYRRGLDTRDRAIADLPFFALWVTNQRVSTDKAHAELVDDWTNKVIAFSQRIDALHAELSKEKGGAPSPKTVSELTEQVLEVQGALRAALGEKIDEVKQDTHSIPLWFDREAILSAPPLLENQGGANAVNDRLALLDFNRATSARFFKEKESDKTSAGDSHKDAVVLAKRNALMAMAAFKDFWPVELARVENESPGPVAETIAKLIATWPAAVNTGLAQSLKEGDLAQAAEMLSKADFLSRGVPGGLEGKADSMSASQALRAVRVHNLLMAQARRTLLDHWYDLADGTPYYETAAKGYLIVARQLVKGETNESTKLRTAQCTQMIDAVKAVGIKIVGKDVDYWTSETDFPVRWTIVTPDDPYVYDAKSQENSSAPPPAVAMTWRTKGAEARGSGDEPRKSITLSGPRHDFPDSYTLTDLAKGKSEDGTITENYTVLLRGQRRTETLKISQKEPDVIVYDFPKPPQAYVKIRMAPEFTYGAVAIALDISGSMVRTDGNFGIVGADGKRQKRIEPALNGLRTALQSIPDDTYVSVTAFVTLEKNADPRIETFLKPGLWKRDKTDQLIADIRNMWDPLESTCRHASLSIL